MNGIARDVFVNLSTDSKLNVLFDYVIELYKQAHANEIRIGKMEQKFIAVAAVFGSIGAGVVLIVKWLIGK